MKHLTVAVPLVVMAVLTACLPPLVQPAPTQMVSPSPPPDTPTPEPGRWHTYTDDELGMTFEYWCWLKEEDGYLGFTDETSLRTEPANGLTLDQYVDQFMQQQPQYGISRDDTRLNHDPKGIVVGTMVSHHQILYAFFQRGDTIYQFSSRQRIITECQAQEMGVYNPDAFYRTVESFRFTK